MDNNAVSEATRHIVAYLLHDAAANVEGYITDYSQQSLLDAEAMGLVIIAEYNDGSREVVPAIEVKQPNPEVNGVEVVLPPYVDVRMSAVVEVFDALEAIMFPEAEPATETGAAPMRKAARKITPEDAFKAALAALKEVTQGGESQ